jgi:WD repeat-containing protein 35
MRRKNSSERGFHIDDMDVIGTSDSDCTTDFSKFRYIFMYKQRRPSNDPICCITGNENTLLVAKTSGQLLVFSMPSMSLEEKYTIPPKTQLIEMNSDGSRAFLIDSSNVLRLLQLEKSSSTISLDLKPKNSLQSVLILLIF